MVSVKETAMKRKCLPFFFEREKKVKSPQLGQLVFAPSVKTAPRLELSRPGRGENVLLGKRFERFGLWSAETPPFMS